MKAIGFGYQVTGGGPNPEIIEVSSGKNSGKNTLEDAIQRANRAGGKPIEIVLRTTVEADTSRGKDGITVTARNLTITASGGNVIRQNLLVFDCSQSDNVLLRNLRFESSGKGEPRDTIKIDGTTGRLPIGFWIDHCFFESPADLSITTNTRDLPGSPPPLLLTVSRCHFFDSNPDGEKNRDHGSLGVHGTGTKNSVTGIEDQQTNAYATICLNYFESTRRRSPRSSNRTFVHAFNNVLEKWGTRKPGKDLDQENGMSAGHFSILAAEANFFKAGALKDTIEIAKKEDPRLYVGKGSLENVYRNGAEPASDVGQPAIVIADEYRRAKIPASEVPKPEVMTDPLRDRVVDESGPA